MTTYCSYKLKKNYNILFFLSPIYSLKKTLFLLPFSSMVVGVEIGNSCGGWNQQQWRFDGLDQWWVVAVSLFFFFFFFKKKKISFAMAKTWLLVDLGLGLKDGILWWLLVWFWVGVCNGGWWIARFRFMLVDGGWWLGFSNGGWWIGFSNGSDGGLDFLMEVVVAWIFWWWLVVLQ